tara:strand:- start:151 stop:864 length:714 start_codon:yes stop_codon:yes gene_type:complete
LSILTLFSACSHQRKFELSNDIERDVKNLLPEGSMQFEVMDKVRQSPRQIELTQKFQGAIRENYDWFLEYSSNIEPGKPMPYHENLGLTEKEYLELQELMDEIELVSSGTLQYQISYSNNEINLIPKDTAENGTVLIDLTQNTVEFDNQFLTFKDTVRITDPKNGFRSEWIGYQWIYENPKDMDMSALKDIQSLEVEQYKFTIGFIKRTGKVYVQIKGREMANGFKMVDYEFPLVEK